MEKNRLEAFSDGVLAIIITIIVLTLVVPNGDQWSDVASFLPALGGYFISFMFVAIYWVNHHLMLKDVEKINVKVLWANNALLFVLSFIPFATGWVGKFPTSYVPIFIYFFVMFLASLAFHVMAYAIVKENGQKFHIDLRGIISLVGYLAAALFGGFCPVVAYIVVTVITLWWVKPAKN